MATTATEGSSEGGGYWNWEDLPEDVQQDFLQSNFAISNIVYQQIVSEAAQKMQQ